MEHINDIYDLFLHSIRVGFMAQAVSKKLALKDDFDRQMFIAGLFHDIGKLSMDQNILHKKEKLTIEEYQYLKSHVLVGSNLIATLPFSNLIFASVSQHHESINGDGYPLGLSDADICLGAKIIKVCDVYDALTSLRSYRPSYSKEEAINIMTLESDKYDSKIMNILFDIIRIDDFSLILDYGLCNRLINNLKERGYS